MLSRKLKIINTMWEDANLPKYIQFGKDERGVQNPACDGPTINKAMATKLLARTINEMDEIYDLIESKRIPEPKDADLPAAKPRKPAPAKGGANPKTREKDGVCPRPAMGRLPEHFRALARSLLRSSVPGPPVGCDGSDSGPGRPGSHDVADVWGGI